MDDIFDKVKVDGDESLPCLGELIEDFVLVAVDDAFDHLPQHGRDSLQLLNERPVPEQTCYNFARWKKWSLVRKVASRSRREMFNS